MKLNALFCDGMVLAANKPIRVFGTGSGCVRITFLGGTVTRHFDAKEWLVELPPQGYGGPYQMSVELNGEQQVISDIYVGEVLLLHGQSNIQFRLKESNYPTERYEGEPRLRLFSLGFLTEESPFLPRDGWVVCDLENVGEWSAIGYHVGMGLIRELGCAVGLIACYQGASVIQTWLPRDAEERLGIELAPEQRHGDYTHRIYREWNAPGTLYHFAIKRIAPFSLSRILWYQGESNTGEGDGAVYDKLLTALIEQRRADFEDADLPIVVIQLANLRSRSDKGWRLVQDAQMRVGKTVPNVTTVISHDLCEDDHIHPPTKSALCDRICRSILKNEIKD